ncbi:MAG: galactose oxidase [Chloroflexota bacterium]|nr:galactose oxidase [Chloroflexota bacterium]
MVFAACTSSVAPSATTATDWRRIGDIPTARSEVATAVLRDAIFVVGGFGGGRIVEAYATDRTAGWAGPKREYPLEVDHAMAAATLGDTGSLFVLGGNVQGQPTARVFRFDGDQWTERAAMPLPRSQAAAVVAGGRIYVVGGITSGSRLLPETFEYDPAADRWRTLAAIPTPRDHLAAAVLDGRVCAIGGRRLSLDANLAAFECYDVPSDRWDRLPDAPTARGGIGAATVGRRLIVIGGEQPSGTFKLVEIYDAASNTWSRGPDLPTPRHGLGVVALGSTVYALTGGPTPGGSQVAVCEALTVP